MTISRALFLACAHLGVACGARTDLEALEDVTLSPPRVCTPNAPERFTDTVATVLAADGRDVWVLLTGPDLAVARVDAETGSAGEPVAEGQLGIWGADAGDGWLYWSSSGFSDFAGQILRARRAGDTEILAEGLFQPGGVQYDRPFLFFAEWTNSGSLADERRGRILRMDPSGGSLRELATELGLPTETALAGEHVYWVDRRRGHLARIHRDGGSVEIVWEGSGIASALGARGDEVFFVSAATVFALDATTLATRALGAVDDREVRALVPAPRGLLLGLWDGAGGGSSLAFLPSDRATPVVLDAGAGSFAADARRLYWARGGDEGEAPGLVRVCLDYLETL